MRILRAIVEPTADLMSAGDAGLFHFCGISAKAMYPAAQETLAGVLLDKTRHAFRVKNIASETNFEQLG
jgi:hypothetical protein